MTTIADSGVGYVMERVDLCLVGAEGVMENGGVVNKVINRIIPMHNLSMYLMHNLSHIHS